VPAYGFSIPLTTEDGLRQYVRAAFGVVIPDVQICPTHSTPWRAFASAYFARNRVEVWKASRGFGGKSFLLAVLGLTEATSWPADVTIIGGSGEQSARVNETQSERLWPHPSAPRYLLASDPARRVTRLCFAKLRDKTHKHSRTCVGPKIRALTSSRKAVRGPHPQRMRIDEADEMDLILLDAAMGQPQSDRGIPAQTVISSTHQYPTGTMSEVLKRAADKDWPVHEWCYRESLEPHGWLSAAEVEAKRSDVTALMWALEYDLQEPAPEGRAIDGDAVERCFDASLGVWRGADGQYVEIEAPSKDGCYATGADWARKQDWTVIVTFRYDVRPARLVAYERMQRRPWPLMVAKLEERLGRFPPKREYLRPRKGAPGFFDKVPTAAHDALGVGDVVSGFLKVEVSDELLVGRERMDAFSEYCSAVERGELRGPRVDTMYREHKFVTHDDLYGRGHPPDSFVAAAIAYKTIPRGRAAALVRDSGLTI
jgi:hypothetical protein